ncbi:heavy metal sensor kinase [Bryocella elongata]|uniref:histidine kinase n=1 Tax=Bryocella elongata TaxID=863522 RepID=A0A1H5Z4X4_9BACT|nr:ATP-binding protein [Bryocella elongata]SEG31391.1 heavy metal sensor kinase [Bryocella elongata]
MKLPRATTLRSRLTLYYLSVLGVLLLVYAALVFAFQSAVLTRQMLHDEVQDIVTVEGLLYFDTHGQLQLHQDYFSRPQSHLLVDRMLEVRDAASDTLVYRSPTLHGMSLGGALLPAEGEHGFDERRFTLTDGTHVFLVSHIHGMGQRLFVIRLAYSLDPFHARMRQFLLLLLLAVPLALLLAGAIGQAVTGRALKPLGEMISHAERITAHDLHDRLPTVDRNDELGQMANVFNALLQRLEAAFTQLQRFTADAAHELRTPLAALRATGEVALQQARSVEQYRDTLSSMLEETSRLGSTIESLLLLARAEATQLSNNQAVFLLQPLIREVIGVLEVLAEDRGIRLIEQNPAERESRIFGDRSLLRLAILNVLHNAVKFSPAGGTVTVATFIANGSPSMVELLIEDQGPGIPTKSAGRIFDRFYVGNEKPESSPYGSGLGLAIADLVVTRSGGTLRFEPTPREGATFVFSFPVVLPD